jgi:hypothetical protein
VLVSVLAVLILAALAVPVQAQTNNTVLPSTQFDTSDFPLWGKDLRRAEIIAFGTFPFTMFTATFAMDTWRASQNGWDGRYMPWPLKTAGAVDMTGKEHEITLAAAGIASLTLALADFIIVQVKRHRDRQRVLRLPAGSPIIIKRPLPGFEPEEPDVPEGETGNPETPDYSLTP